MVFTIKIEVGIDKNFKIESKNVVKKVQKFISCKSKGEGLMISNQILQNTIEGIKTISRMELCVVDIDGKILAITNKDMEDRAMAAADFGRSPADSQEVAGNRFFKIYSTFSKKSARRLPPKTCAFHEGCPFAPWVSLGKVNA